MAKKKTASTTKSIVYRPEPVKAAPITINVPRQQAIAAPKKPSGKKGGGGGHRSHGGGGNGDLTSKANQEALMGGALLGVVSKQDFYASIPALPLIGQEGTAAIIAWWMFNKDHPNAVRGAIGAAGFAMGQNFAESPQKVKGTFAPGVAAVMP